MGEAYSIGLDCYLVPQSAKIRSELVIGTVERREDDVWFVPGEGVRDLLRPIEKRDTRVAYLLYGIEGPMEVVALRNPPEKYGLEVVGHRPVINRRVLPKKAYKAKTEKIGGPFC